MCLRPHLRESKEPHLKSEGLLLTFMNRACWWIVNCLCEGGCSSASTGRLGCSIFKGAIISGPSLCWEEKTWVREDMEWGWHTKWADELAIFHKKRKMELSMESRTPFSNLRAFSYFPFFSQETQRDREKWKRKKEARRQGARFMSKAEMGEDKLWSVEVTFCGSSTVTLSLNSCKQTAKSSSSHSFI